VCDVALEALHFSSPSSSALLDYAYRRAEEASNDFLARDWSEVALVVARKTGKRPPLLARMFL
jgi:hypothetical protein